MTRRPLWGNRWGEPDPDILNQRTDTMRTTIDAPAGHPRYPRIALALLVLAIATGVQAALSFYPYGIAGEELGFAIDVTFGVVVTWLWTYGVALVVGWIIRKVDHR